MLCKKCGSNLPDDAKYCEKCGADQIRPDTSNTRLKWIAICCGGAILFVIISGFIISMPSSGSYSKDVIISKELDSMALTINDLSGWKTGKTTRMAELQGINTNINSL
jgi:surface protein